MAHHKSAKKRIRQIEKRTVVNRARRGRMRTFIKKVESAIEQGDKTTANQALREAEPEIRRAATKGVIHLNTASRKISRLSSRVKALSA